MRISDWSSDVCSSDLQTEFYTFPDFFRGQTPGPIGGYYYGGDLIDGYDDAAAFLKGISDIWHNTNGAGGANDWERAQDRPFAVNGWHYLPKIGRAQV